MVEDIVTTRVYHNTSKLVPFHLISITLFLKQLTFAKQISINIWMIKKSFIVYYRNVAIIWENTAWFFWFLPSMRTLVGWLLGYGWRQSQPLSNCQAVLSHGAKSWCDCGWVSVILAWIIHRLPCRPPSTYSRRDSVLSVSSVCLSRQVFSLCRCYSVVAAAGSSRHTAHPGLSWSGCCSGQGHADGGSLRIVAGDNSACCTVEPGCWERVK